MSEVWLRANPRPWLAWLAGDVLLTFVSAAITYQNSRDLVFVGAWVAIGIVLGILGLITMPRVLLRNEDAHLVINRQGHGRSRVPIDVVEGFLLGQGPSYLPGKRAGRLETTTLVIRLAERASEWERMPMPPRLGNWCGHYVTLRGTWCETLSLDLVNRLNERLHAVKQARPAEQVTA